MTENQKLREALQAIANIDDATSHSVDASAALDRIGQIARQALALPTKAEPAAQPITMTESERADMICAVAQICTGSSRRTLAALAIEWTERRYGIASKAQTTPQPAPAIAELPPYIYGREAGANEKVWTEQAVRAALSAQAVPIQSDDLAAWANETGLEVIDCPNCGELARSAKPKAQAVPDERDKVDAQRYRWLADCLNYPEAITLISDGSLTADALGKAIDAAMRKGKP